MSPIAAVKRCLTSGYANFQGRARRSEYWWFALFNAIIQFVILGLGLGSIDWETVAQRINESPGEAQMILFGALGMWGIIWLLWALAMLVPGVAVTVRRLHDSDKTGWLALLAYVPIVQYIGGIVIFIMMLLPGTPGPNKFGPDPKAIETPGMGGSFQAPNQFGNPYGQ